MTDLAYAYQADLLAVCYTDQDAFAHVRSYIDSEAFTIPQIKWLWDLGCHTLDEHNELPSSGLVAQEAQSSWPDGRQLQLLIAVHQDLLTGRESSKSILARSVEFATQQKFKAACSKQNKLVEAGRYEEARALMESQPWAIQASKLEERIVYGYDDHDKLLDEAKDRRDSPVPYKMSTGIPALDAALNGGIPLGDILTIVGFTGRGKTTLLLNLIDAFIMAGRGGALLNSEMKPDILMAKLWARRSRIGHNVIFEYQFSPEQESEYFSLMEEYKRNLSGLLFVKQLGIGGMTRPNISRAFDQAEKFLKEFSWGALDSFDHIEVEKRFGGDTIRGRESNANWVHDQAGDRNLTLAGTTQSNRGGAKFTGLENVANTMEFARNAQEVVAVNDDEDANESLDPKDDTDEILSPPSRLGGMVLSLLKARLGQPGNIPISTDLACSFMGDAAMDEHFKAGGGPLPGMDEA